ncbi:MAG: family 43 glycosylhydrolase [Spirochaetales bacterium]|nr:family 43 glycosylhydrolase [Spirochaetales bacterium]
MFRNPIITGFNPDPSICFADGKYYIVTSTFEYFPGVTIWESTDLVNWSYCDSVLKTARHLDLDRSPDSLGLYAATLRHHNGRFYMVTTNKYLKFNFVVSAQDIHGPWTEPAEIWKTGIDPSLFFTDDGRCFYTSNGEIDPYTKSRGIFGAFINPDTGEMLEPFKPISAGCGGSSTEAPHIYFRKGWYYLILAEGGTGMGHHVCALRSRDIHGPYEQCPFNPVLSHASRKGHDIQCTGHADLIDLGDDRWIAVFLATRRNTSVPLTTLGRESFMAPVTWTDDGWPVIGDNGHVELEMPDIVPAKQRKRDPLFIDFRKDLSFYPLFKLRVPKDECYIQDAEAGSMALDGQDRLETPLGHPTMLLVRQPEFNTVFSARLDTSSLEGTAGVCAWLQTNYHARLEIRKENGKTTASMYRHIHDFGALSAEKEITGCTDSIGLRIVTTRESYEFYAGDQLVDSISYAGLTTGCTCGNCFTGTLLGIFAQDGKAVFLDGINVEEQETT